MYREVPTDNGGIGHMTSPAVAELAPERDGDLSNLAGFCAMSLKAWMIMMRMMMMMMIA